MLKGIFRLAIVLAILSWIGTLAFHFYHLQSDVWRFEQHFSPHLRGKHSDMLPSELSWPVYAAREEFVSLPSKERWTKAEDFYDLHIEPWENLYRLEGLKKWILETSQHTVEQARIIEGGWNGIVISYRSFHPPGIIVVPRLSYVLFSSTTLSITIFSAIVVNILSVISLFIGRWVWRGFHPPGKRTIG